MNKKLFWKLCLSISLVSMALVYLTSEVSLMVERKMSLISTEAKHQMEHYRQQADSLVQAGDKTAIAQWLEDLQDKEDTFASIIQLNSKELVPIVHTDYTPIQIRLGRNPDWEIHLYHDNPFIELPLNDGQHYLVFRLPDRMMPGQYWPITHMFLHLIVPLLLMVLVSFLLYRHLMKPLQELEQATRQFSSGDYHTRVAPRLNGRDDELGRLAVTFDEMTAEVGHLVETQRHLVETQRHLIHDLSHELRTPLQRIELCIESEKGAHYSRLKREANQMRQLTEDALTLAWLQNESPELRHETVDLVGLLEAITEDCQFEFPARQLSLIVPDELELHDSSEKALNMALENIIRNAMRHTPIASTVTVSAWVQDAHCHIQIQDQGPGVEAHYLELIFKPFFRTDKARDRDSGGFGLGLALAKRQIEAMGGQINASNGAPNGLIISMHLPMSHNDQTLSISMPLSVKEA